MGNVTALRIILSILAGVIIGLVVYLALLFRDHLIARRQAAPAEKAPSAGSEGEAAAAPEGETPDEG